MIPIETWHLEFGDPTPIGWVTTIGYLVAAGLCLGTAFQTARSSRRVGSVRFWFILAAAMMFLGINKQLDLQTGLKIFGKNLALQDGWYEKRRGVQLVFLAVVVGIGGVLLAALAWWTLRGSREDWPVLVGVGLLGVYILLRASAFEHLDERLKIHLDRGDLNTAIELAGIGWVASGAGLGLRRMRRGQPKV